MTDAKEPTLLSKNAKPSAAETWLVILALIFIEPVGVVLWFKFFKRPHAIIKTLVSLILFMIWILTVAGIIAAATGYKAPASKLAQPTPAQATTTAPPKAKIGQTVGDAGFNFTVNSLKCGEKEISYGSVIKYYSDAQGQYCRLNVTITNTGNAANSIDVSDQHVYNSQNQEYSYASDATAAAAHYYAGAPLDDDINPGNSVTGDIVYDVPVGVTPTTATLHGDYGSTGAQFSLQ